MYCKNCGALIKDTDKICLSCGAANFPEAADIRSEDESLPDERSPREMANTVFSMGLLSAVLSATVVFALPGWILSGVAKRRAREYEENFGEVYGRAKAGKTLGNVGLGLGLGYTCFLGLVAVLSGLVALLTYL